MALRPDHQALDLYLRDVNAGRSERVTGVTVLEPEPVTAPMVPGGFVPPKAWMRSTPDGPFCVRYRYRVDEYVYRHRADTPADLVRFMRDAFRGNPYLDVLKVYEA